ncbi:hypothetical protein SBBP1_20018 [Burkholderiales bacterium]|nr:hypothetical protein SBBP1_20018 [Burkholderiales bacterium]
MLAERTAQYAPIKGMDFGLFRA